MRDDEAVQDLVSRLGIGLAPDGRSPGTTPDEAEALERLWARVAPGRGGDEAAVPDLTARRARRHVRRRVLVGAAAAAALAVAAVVGGRPAPALAVAPVLAFSQVDPGDLGPTSGTPAGDTLAALAAAARGTSAPSRPAGAAAQHVVADRWRLEVSVDGQGAATLTVRPVHTESWLQPGGRLRVRETATGATFSPDGRMSSRPAPVTEVRDDTASSPRSPSYAGDLPTDPAELSALWLRDLDPTIWRAPSPATILTHRLTDLYDAWVVPPATNAAVWEALAATGEVRDLGDVTDRAGRPGRALAVWDDSTTTLVVLVADPRSGALLGQEDVVLDYPGVESSNHLEGPTVAAFTSYLASEWVR